MGLALETEDSAAAARVELTDLVVLRTGRSRTVPMLGQGLSVFGGSKAVVERGLWEDCPPVGAVSFDRDPSRPSATELVDATVRTSACVSGACDHAALGAQGASSLTLRRATVVGPGPIGIAVSANTAAHGASLDAEDLLVARQGWRLDGSGGGLFVSGGSRARLARAVLSESAGVAVWAGLGTGDLPAASFVAEDLVVRGTQPGPSGENGAGLASVEGAALEVRRALLSANHLVAISVGDSLDRVPAQTRLEDLTVLDTRPSPLETDTGFGLQILRGADVVVERVLMEQQTSAGIAVTGGELGVQPTRLVVKDVVIRDTRSGEAGENGFGLFVQAGAEVDVQRGRFERNRSIGVLALGRDADREMTRLQLDDVAVLDTLRARCGELREGEPFSCVEGAENHGSGHGLGVDGDVLVRTDGFLISGSAFAGLVVAWDADVRLHRGVVTDNAIGINLMDPDYDTTRLTDEVFVYDNRTDWTRTAVSLPQPLGAIGVLRPPDL